MSADVSLYCFPRFTGDTVEARVAAYPSREYLGRLWQYSINGRFYELLVFSPGNYERAMQLPSSEEVLVAIEILPIKKFRENTMKRVKLTGGIILDKTDALYQIESPFRVYFRE